jgi:Na+/melibiose symporter-like transporter
MRDDTSEPGRFHLGDVVGELPGIGGLGPGFEGGGEVHPAVPPAGEHPAGVAEAEELPLRKSFLYGSGNFGSGVWYAFNNFILPGFLDPLHVPAPIIGLLASTRSFEGSVIQPVVGAWSDRTWSRRLGRRRPFIVRFVPISALFVVLTAFFPDLVNVGPLGSVARALHIPPTGLVLGLVFAGIFLFTVTFNIMYDPYQALLADITPERQRGRVNGVFQALGASGQSFILVIGAFFLGAVGGVTGLFLICGISLAVFFIPTVLGVREPRELPGVERHRRYTLRDYWNGIKWFHSIVLHPAACRYR